MPEELKAQLASSLTPTSEQHAIIEAIPKPESQLIQAYAGTAKTTTLVMAAQQVRHPALALAFNKKIAQKLAAKLPRSFSVLTLNALGYRAWRQARPTLNHEMKPELRGKIISEVAKSAGLRDEGAWGKLRDLVNALQAIGATPPGEGQPLAELNLGLWKDICRQCWIDQGELEAFGEASLEVLRQSITWAKRGTLTSFDDQLYMPLCFGGKWSKFGLVFGDEVQDWNALNHEMVKRCLSPEAKLVLAGDQRQSLYAFRGALGDSMERARKLAPSWIDQKLTLTFRCPHAVVERQQGHAPGYKASPSNPQGRVLRWNEYCACGTDDSAEGKNEWSWEDLQTIAGRHSCAVLCRNNAPLLHLCLQLLRRGITTTFLGKDLGKSLISLAKKVCGKVQGAELLQAKIAGWREKELANLEPEASDDTINDRAECLLAVAEGLESGQALVLALERLFAQEGPVQFATIHRAKGLEWDVVMFLDPWRVPRKGAKGVELEQELNAKYVAETRTRDVLILANLADLVWQEEPSNAED